jgi:hypothetical protein
MGIFKAEDLVPVPRAMVKSHVEQQKYLGDEKFPAPNERWTDDDWKAHYGRLGVPEAPDGYEIERPTDLPENIQIDDDAEKELIGLMHKHHLDPRQAKGLYNDYLSLIAEQSQAQLAATREDLETRNKAFETSLGGPKGLEQVQTRAGEAVLRHGGPETAQAIADLVLPDGSFVKDHPAFVSLMANVHKNTGEHVSAAAPGRAGDFGMAPQEAAAESSKILDRMAAMAIAGENHTQEYLDLQARLDQVGRVAGEALRRE